MDDVQMSLRQRYHQLHPLVFQRSVERAKSNGELFDLLEEASGLEMPVVWDEKEKTWKNTDDLLQGLALNNEK